MYPRSRPPMALCGLVLFAAALFVAPATAPAQTIAEDVAVPSSAIDRLEMLTQANAATVKIQCSTVRGGRRVRSNGAGVIISGDGFVLTAHHVVKGFRSIRVTTVNGDRLPAFVMFSDEAWDIAVLIMDTRSMTAPLSVASVGVPEQIVEGKSAMVVGNPLGMGQAAVRAKLGPTRRVTWDGHRNILRTVEADIRKGNSGGGTFDLHTGELLGINVAKSATRALTGYMVPVDRLLAILDGRMPILELADAQEIRGVLGVQLRPVTVLEGPFDEGVMITAIDADSPADRAGMQIGDILVGLERYRTQTPWDVLYVLQNLDTQREASLNYLVSRGDEVDRGTVQLGVGGEGRAASALRTQPAETEAVPR